MTDDSLLPFDLPAVAGRKLTVDFDGRLSSDGGPVLLREADGRCGLSQGFDIHSVVTSLEGGPRFLYGVVYSARGQVENLIKQLKCQLAADRTSCSSTLANQLRLLLHTAAYWLMHGEEPVSCALEDSGYYAPMPSSSTSAASVTVLPQIVRKRHVYELSARVWHGQASVFELHPGVCSGLQQHLIMRNPTWA